VVFSSVNEKKKKKWVDDLGCQSVRDIWPRDEHSGERKGKKKSETCVGEGKSGWPEFAKRGFRSREGGPGTQHGREKASQRQVARVQAAIQRFASEKSTFSEGGTEPSFKAFLKESISRKERRKARMQKKKASLRKGNW